MIHQIAALQNTWLGIVLLPVIFIGLLFTIGAYAWAIKDMYQNPQDWPPGSGWVLFGATGFLGLFEMTSS